MIRVSWLSRFCSSRWSKNRWKPKCRRDMHHPLRLWGRNLMVRISRMSRTCRWLICQTAQWGTRHQGIGLPTRIWHPCSTKMATGLRKGAIINRCSKLLEMMNSSGLIMIRIKYSNRASCRVCRNRLKSPLFTSKWSKIIHRWWACRIVTLLAARTD